MENGKKFLDGDKVGGVDRQNQGKKNLVGRTRRGQSAWYEMSKQSRRRAWRTEGRAKAKGEGNSDLLLYTIWEISIHYTFCPATVSMLSNSWSLASSTPGRAIGAERVAKGIGSLGAAGDRACRVGRKPSTSLRLTESLR